MDFSAPERCRCTCNSDKKKNVASADLCPFKGHVNSIKYSPKPTADFTSYFDDVATNFTLRPYNNLKMSS